VGGHGTEDGTGYQIDVKIADSCGSVCGGGGGPQKTQYLQVKGKPGK
jgi:hypothetical protein